MSKKLLSVVLALALVLSSFAVSAFAIGGIGFEDEEDAALYTQAWALSAEPTDIGGGKYTVDVYLTANYKVGPIEFQILRNVTAGSLKLVDAVAGSAIPAEWEANVAHDIETADDPYTGKVTINPDPVDEGALAINEPTNAHIATLTFEASADVAATIAINVADAKSENNPGGTLIAARMSDGNVVTGTAITGQTVSQDTNTVVFGNAAPPAQAPELAVIDGTIGVIDTDRTEMDAEDVDGDGDTKIVTGYIYGVEPENGETLYDIFEVVGDGEMNVIPTDAGEGTGTMVQVLDLDGNVVAEYVLIIFGDVNGDGYVSTDDSGAIELHDAYVYGYNFDTWEDELGLGGRMMSYQVFAADLNVDGDATTDDSGAIELHDAYVFGYNFDTWEDDLGLGGRFTQEYIMSLI